MALAVPRATWCRHVSGADAVPAAACRVIFTPGVDLTARVGLVPGEGRRASVDDVRLLQARAVGGRRRRHGQLEEIVRRLCLGRAANAHDRNAAIVIADLCTGVGRRLGHQQATQIV